MPFHFLKFYSPDQKGTSEILLFAARFLTLTQKDGQVVFTPSGWKIPLAVLPRADVAEPRISSAIAQDLMGEGALSVTLAVNSYTGAWRPRVLPPLRGEGPLREFKMLAGCRDQDYVATIKGQRGTVGCLPGSITQVEHALSLAGHQIVPVASRAWKGFLL